jgi:ribosomal protein S18 acetylase RimI-like enzyme
MWRREVIGIIPYEPEFHRGDIREILARNGWEDRYISGQLDKLDVLSGDPEPGTRGKAYVTESDGLLGGFVCVEFREWNRLGQLHGLAVDPDLKRRSIASALVSHAERFVREEGGRGIYVDTPATNEVARSFYLALGYQYAYTMPEYYDVGLDGVTYLKLFHKVGTRLP